MTRASPPAHFTSNASEEVEGEGGSSRGGSRVGKPGVALRSLAAGHFETARQGVWGALAGAVCLCASPGGGGGAPRTGAAATRGQRLPPPPR